MLNSLETTNDYVTAQTELSTGNTCIIALSADKQQSAIRMIDITIVAFVVQLGKKL